MIPQKYAVLFPLVIGLITLPGHFARKCSSVSDCACGKQCVNVADQNRICYGNANCVCKPGCAVADKYIARGDTKDTYGNSCSCPSGQNDGKPACTRKRWDTLPNCCPLYHDNPACQAPQY